MQKKKEEEEKKKVEEYAREQQIGTEANDRLKKQIEYKKKTT